MSHPTKKNSPASSRKERDRNLREQDFLNAAEHLFSQNGFFETSMEDVAAEAGYATGTIYRYFKSKEALYQQLLLEKGRSYFDVMEENMKAVKTPMERLQAMIRGKVHFFFVNKDFMRIYMNQVSSPVGSRCQAPDGLMDIMETYREWWRKIFRDGIRRGDFKKHDPERLLDTVTGMTNELLANALNDASSSEDELVEYILAFLEGGLIRKDPSS